MQRQEAIGVFFLVDALVLLFTGVGGYQELFTLAMVMFFFGLLYIGAYKNGTIGPFKWPLVITFIVLLLGYLGGFYYRNVPADPTFIFGFTPGVASIVFLVWFFPFFLNVAYGRYFNHLMENKEIKTSKDMTTSKEAKEA